MSSDTLINGQIIAAGEEIQHTRIVVELYGSLLFVYHCDVLNLEYLPTT